MAVSYGVVQKRNDAKKYNAKTVSNLPLGFVSLNDAITSSEGALSYVCWETQISFLDSNETCVYQTDIKDDSFIVKYKGNYYISKSKYNEMLEAVTNDREQLLQPPT